MAVIKTGSTSITVNYRLGGNDYSIMVVYRPVKTFCESQTWE